VINSRSIPFEHSANGKYQVFKDLPHEGDGVSRYGDLQERSQSNAPILTLTMTIKRYLFPVNDQLQAAKLVGN
jgi:aminopeptidase-like protein